MTETQIITDIIPKSFQDDIQHELLDTGYFPWYYNPSTVDSSKQYAYAGIGSMAGAVDSPQLYHLLINRETGVSPSTYYNLIKPIFYFLEKETGIEAKEITRIKANLLMPFKGQQGGTHHPHIDQELPDTKTLIYYVKDSDGDTFTYNEYFDGTKQSNFTIEKQITPKKGTAVLLDTTRYHASNLPKITDARSVINFVFKI
jgi:hypothetical protein